MSNWDYSLFQTTMRVWDVLFFEGAKILFNIALAFFKVISTPVTKVHLSTHGTRFLILTIPFHSILTKMNEEKILLTHHVGEVINIIQKTTHHLFDPDELLTVWNFSIHFSIYFSNVLTIKCEKIKKDMTWLLHFRWLLIRLVQWQPITYQSKEKSKNPRYWRS